MIKLKNKYARTIVGTLTLGVGGWFIFEVFRTYLEPIASSLLSKFIIGSVLVLIGITNFGLKAK